MAIASLAIWMRNLLRLQQLYLPQQAFPDYHVASLLYCLAEAACVITAYSGFYLAIP